MASVRDKIIELLNNKKHPILATDQYFYLDYYAIDISDTGICRLLCKFNTTPAVMIKPTFGSCINNNGLIEVVLPYDKIYAIEDLDAANDLLEILKKKNPAAYNWWSKVNYVEGVDWNHPITIVKSKVVNNNNEKTEKEKEIEKKVEEVKTYTYNEIYVFATNLANDINSYDKEIIDITLERLNYYKDHVDEVDSNPKHQRLIKLDIEDKISKINEQLNK